MFKKKIVIIITVTAVSLYAVLYKLDYKMSQADKHPDWPIFIYEGHIDSLGCKAKGDIVIKAMDMCPSNRDSVLKILKMDSALITKGKKDDVGNTSYKLPTNFPNLQVIDSSTNGNEFSWGSTFSGVWSNNGGSIPTKNDIDDPIAFLHNQNSYIKVRLGIKEGLFKIKEHDLGGTAWFYQLNYPKKDSDTLFFFYRWNDLFDNDCITLFYAFKK